MSKLLGQVLQGTYRIERLLGEGGMGSVYLASHARVRRTFAVKLLSPAIAALPEALARFRREAEVTSRLGHPHIVEVVDFNQTDDGQPYIVMEQLQGVPLNALIKRDGALTLQRALDICEQTGSALTAAHDQGVIHRDLKPSNIFICHHPGVPDRAKVLDFGISKVVGSGSALTRTHTTMGTPSYMSPEQAEGRAADVDARTDLFALATLLYEMLSGRPPFVGDTIPAVLYQVVHQAPLPLLELRPGLPATVTAAIDKAMSKQRTARHPSIAAFIAELSNGPAPAMSLAATAVAAAPELRTTAASTEPVPDGPQPTVASRQEELDRLPRSRRGWLAITGTAIAGCVALAALLSPSAEPPPGPARPTRSATPVLDASIPDVRLSRKTPPPTPRPSKRERPIAPREPIAEQRRRRKPATDRSTSEPSPPKMPPRRDRHRPDDDDGWDFP